MFMALFLFTIVNTQYGPGRHIEPDLASVFAAISTDSARLDRGAEVMVIFAETKVFIIQR